MLDTSSETYFAPIKATKLYRENLELDSDITLAEMSVQFFGS